MAPIGEIYSFVSGLIAKQVGIDDFSIDLGEIIETVSNFVFGPDFHLASTANQPSSVVGKSISEYQQKLKSQPSVTITSQDFANIINDWSEDIPSEDVEATYSSTDFLSNENINFGDILYQLKPMGGVYVGIGTEQNYSYIGRIQPEVAFIVDIRHENIFQHLLIKALLEISESRVDFLSKLFLRKLPPKENYNDDIWHIIHAIEHSEPLDEEEVKKLKDEVFSRIKGYGVDTTQSNIITSYTSPVNRDTTVQSDLDFVDFYWGEFAKCGANMSYSGCPKGTSSISESIIPHSHQRPGGSLIWKGMIDTCGYMDNSLHWLGREEKFLYIKKMHHENRIIPIQADVSGRFTFPKIRKYCKENNLTVSCMYISNVSDYLEYYYSQFRRNYEILPQTPDSILIYTSGLTNPMIGAIAATIYLEKPSSSLYRLKTEDDPKRCLDSFDRLVAHALGMEEQIQYIDPFNELLGSKMDIDGNDFLSMDEYVYSSLLLNPDFDEESLRAKFAYYVEHVHDIGFEGGLLFCLEKGNRANARVAAHHIGLAVPNRRSYLIKVGFSRPESKDAALAQLESVPIEDRPELILWIYERMGYFPNLDEQIDKLPKGTAEDVREKIQEINESKIK